jgi:hypothetical protein
MPPDLRGSMEAANGSRPFFISNRKLLATPPKLGAARTIYLLRTTSNDGPARSESIIATLHEVPARLLSAIARTRH